MEVLWNIMLVALISKSARPVFLCCGEFGAMYCTDSFAPKRISRIIISRVGEKSVHFTGGTWYRLMYISSIHMRVTKQVNVKIAIFTLSYDNECYNLQGADVFYRGRHITSECFLPTF